MEKMYALTLKNGRLFIGCGTCGHFRNEVFFGSLQSGSDDILENQLIAFHVEHNKQIIRHINIIKMKKFIATRQNFIEFLVAPTIEEAQKMFERLYPGQTATIEETTIF